MVESGKLAVVTGASSGIGAASAEALAAAGWRVVLVARGREKLEEIQRRITAKAGRATIEPVDAGDGEAALAMARRVREEHGVPDLVINSAGAGEWRFIEESPPQDAVRMMGAPYFAAYNVTHAFMKDMLTRGRGHFLHVGSPASVIPWPGATAYTCARCALWGLNASLNVDLHGTGVRSSHVVFGEVTSAYFENNPGTKEHIPSIGKMVPVMTPEQCAAVIMSVVRRPRREVVRPLMLWAFYQLAWAWPALVRWLLVSTGRRHGSTPAPVASPPKDGP